MPSFSRHSALAVAALLLGTAARAQTPQPAEGFAVERLYTSAPGGGWFVMDSLDLQGGLGGAVSMTSGYERNALRITEGTQQLAVVSTRAFLDIGAAVTYDRWRVYVNLDLPLYTGGHSGTLDGYTFTAPLVNLAQNPDTLSDARVGVDVRLLGGPGSPFRLGASAQLIIPSGFRSDYDTDGTYRAMFRLLFAGDIGQLTYAGQLGVHVRPLDAYPTPQSPEGSELLFGLAAGARLPAGPMDVVVGPELYGATPFQTFFGTTTTALEGLMTLRLEGTANDVPQLRFKLGVGWGIQPEFGAPQWRIVFAIELFNHNQTH